MTSNVTSSSYYRAVLAELADLPESARVDLLDDLSSHLSDVEAEGVPIDQRLGPPEQYAVDLRTAAGYELPATAKRLAPKSIWDGRVVDRLHGLDRAIGLLLGFASAVAVWKAIAPGWWVLRGYLVGMLVLGTLFGWYHGVLPRAEGLPHGGRMDLAVGTLVVIATTIISMRVGIAAPRWRLEYRIAIALAGILLAGIALVNLHLIDGEARTAVKHGYAYLAASLRVPLALDW
jgi:HAAS